VIERTPVALGASHPLNIMYVGISLEMDSCVTYCSRGRYRGASMPSGGVILPGRLRWVSVRVQGRWEAHQG